MNQMVPSFSHKPNSRHPPALEKQKQGTYLPSVLSVKAAEAPLRLLAPSQVSVPQRESKQKSGNWLGLLPCDYDKHFRDMNITGIKGSCPGLAGSESRAYLLTAKPPYAVLSMVPQFFIPGLPCLLPFCCYRIILIIFFITLKILSGLKDMKEPWRINFYQRGNTPHVGFFPYLNTESQV